MKNNAKNNSKFDSFDHLLARLDRRFSFIVDPRFDLSHRDLVIELVNYIGLIIESPFADQIEAHFFDLYKQDSSEHKELGNKVKVEIAQAERKIRDVIGNQQSDELKKLFRDFENTKQTRVIFSDNTIEDHLIDSLTLITQRIISEGNSKKIEGFIQKKKNGDFVRIILGPTIPAYEASLRHFKKLQDIAIWQDWGNLKEIYFGLYKSNVLWKEATESDDTLEKMAASILIKNANEFLEKDNQLLSIQQYRGKLLHLHQYLNDQLHVFEKNKSKKNDYIDFSDIEIKSIMFEPELPGFRINENSFVKLDARKSKNSDTPNIIKFIQTLWKKKVDYRKPKTITEDSFIKSMYLINICEVKNSENLRNIMRRANNFFINRSLPLEIECIEGQYRMIRHK